MQLPCSVPQQQIDHAGYVFGISRRHPTDSGADDAVEVSSGDGKLGMGNGEDCDCTAILDGDDDGSELDRGRCMKRPSGPRAGVASLAPVDSTGVSS